MTCVINLIKSFSNCSAKEKYVFFNPSMFTKSGKILKSRRNLYKVIDFYN